MFRDLVARTQPQKALQGIANRLDVKVAWICNNFDEGTGNSDVIPSIAQEHRLNTWPENRKKGHWSCGAWSRHACEESRTKGNLKVELIQPAPSWSNALYTVILPVAYGAKISRYDPPARRWIIIAIFISPEPSTQSSFYTYSCYLQAP
jgi:hypothetical protein